MIILNKRDSLFWKFAEYSLYVFICLFPFINFNIFLFGGTSSRSATIVFWAIVLGLAFSAWLFKKVNNLSIPKSPILIAVAAYFLFIVVSAIWGLNFSTSFWSVATRTSGIWYLISLGFIAYMLWAVFSDRNKQNKLILCLIFSTALFSVVSLLGPEGFNWIFKTYISDAFTFGNSTFAGMYIFGAFLLSIYYLLQADHKKWWMYVMPILLVINPNIINGKLLIAGVSGGLVGEARASAYSIVIALAALIVIWLVSKIKMVKTKTIVTYSIFSISVLGFVLCAISLLSHDGYLRGLYLSTTKDARPVVWEMSERVIAQHPYFGWGGDNFERVFETNYDNRVLQDEYGKEAWFDRAHNIFIDQLVDNGFVGLVAYALLYVVIILSLVYVTLKSAERKDRIFASVLIVYFSLHLVELQTAFDTAISYPMLAMMVVFSVILFDRTRVNMTKKENEIDMGSWYKYPVSVLILLFFAWSFVQGLVPFVRAQIANGSVRTSGSSDGRILEYGKLFNSPVDKHSFLWKTSTDFQKAIGQNPKIVEDPKKAEMLKKELVIFENEYRTYSAQYPKHFRARLNLADMLIYQRLFGVNKLDEAQEVLDEAISMVPQAPQPYWMKAVAYVYMKKFDLAREYAKKAFDLNPKIKQSQDVIDYVERSIKSFPAIDLYFFKQI